MRTVTVVVSSFNGEKYIKEQIDSILSQKHCKISLIVRDDGSSDDTIAILHQYEKKGQLKLVQGENLKPAKSFLEALKHSGETDYYAFSDQDDIWLDDKLISAISFLEKENNHIPLMYYSSTTLVNENLDFIAQHNIHLKRNDLARFIFNDMSGNTMVFNNELRNKIIDNSEFDIYIHDKWVLQLCLSIGGKCVGDIESHILYRQHGNNTIGMEVSLKDKIKKFFYVINQPSDKHLRYLYLIDTIEPYKDIIEKCNKSEKMVIKDKLLIILNKNIKFDNFLFKIAFIIRVLKGNL